MNKKGLVVSILAMLVAAGAGYMTARKQMAGPSSADIASAQSLLTASRSGSSGKGDAATLTAALSGKVITVKAGETIQNAVNTAQPGDTIQVMPGTYNETVYIDKDNIALIGVLQDGKWPVLDGMGKLNDAVLYSGNGIRVENLKIVKFKGRQCQSERCCSNCFWQRD